MFFIEPDIIQTRHQPRQIKQWICYLIYEPEAMFACGRVMVVSYLVTVINYLKVQLTVKFTRGVVAINQCSFTTQFTKSSAL